jgi:hypothetical protein
MKTPAVTDPIAEAERAEVELQRQLLLIESMLRQGCSEQEIVAALEGG